MADKKEKKFLIDNPKLMAEWNWEKNNELGLDPKTLTLGSHQKAWWKCSKGHEWQAIISNRNKGRNCSYCSGKKILIGFNDLATINHKLVSEWNYEKNGDLKPEDFTAGSEKKVWWKCNKGHEWQSTIANRNKGSGCPYCSGRYAIKGESDFVSINPQLAQEWNYEKNGNLKPEDFTSGSNKKVWWKCNKGHEWKAVIVNRNAGIGCPICSGHKVLAGFNDLATINPKLAIEWNYEKNGDLKPEEFTTSSGKKVWWKCSKGHEWQSIIANRNKDVGCPFCSSQKVLKGYNDLATKNPTLVKEWNYVKNGDLKPEDFTANSGKKVWWKCGKGHEWISIIANRSKGNDCPYCAGQKAIKGYNDLATLDPGLANEWNYEKNGRLTPEQVTLNSNKTVWWKCTKGHEWTSIIANRNKGNACPICNSERNTSFPEYAIEYYLEKNGVKTIHTYKEKGYELDIYIPSKKIAIEYDGSFWHQSKTKKDLEKNLKCKKDGIKLYRIREGLPLLNDISIDFIVDNNKKDLGEVLQKVLSEIVGVSVEVNLERDNIEIESLRVYAEKANSLLYANPKLAKEWNYEKNGNLKPENFLIGSEKKVWWKCSKGHEWQAQIAYRNKGCGCPICSNKQILIGYNDLSTINPKLASEWNYEKNGDLKPEHFTANSGKKVWWKCAKGHEWQAIIYNRNYGNGCPYCSGRKKEK